MASHNDHFPKRFVFSTDFCLANTKSKRSNQPELELPRHYMFNQIRDPVEFILGENLNSARRKKVEYKSSKTTFGANSTQKSERSHLNSKQSSTFQNVMQTVPMKMAGTVLTKQEYKNANFIEPVLSKYISSSSTVYDQSIRPLFDNHNFFPYEPILTTANRVVLRISRLKFRTKYIEFPLQSIQKMSVFLTLVRADKCVSNIVEIPLHIQKINTWKPSTFHEYDFIIESDAEVSLYAEVVAFVRVPSTRQPFSIKSSLLAENSLGFIEYRKGGFQPIPDGKLKLYMNRDGDIPSNGQEAILSFHFSHHKSKYPILPHNFICPTSCITIYETLRLSMMKALDPFMGNFSIFNPLTLEPIIFKDISLSDKALQILAETWTDHSEAGLREQIKLIYPATAVMSKTGPFCLLSNADSVEKATVRVASGLINGKMIADEKLKPFHTDELRRRFVLSIPAIFE